MDRVPRHHGLLSERWSASLGLISSGTPAGPPSRLWGAGHAAGRVVGIGPETGDERILATLDRRSGPHAATVDPWRRVWYSEQNGDTAVVYDP